MQASFLNLYLSKTEFDNLLRDKDRLTKKLQAMEHEKSQLMDDAEEYTQLQQQVWTLPLTFNLYHSFDCMRPNSVWNTDLSSSWNRKTRR